MNKSKIYTRRGDEGSTSLVGGQRVSKTHCRLEAYGSVDELSANLGFLATMLSDEMAQNVRKIQSYLFEVSAILATENPSGDCRFADEAVAWLERQIDLLDEQLPQLKSFILSGGSQPAAYAHVCRTVCRRAERRVCVVAEEFGVPREIRRFINRLSDYLFVLARYLNKKENVAEIKWEKACK